MFLSENCNNNDLLLVPAFLSGLVAAAAVPALDLHVVLVFVATVTLPLALIFAAQADASCVYCIRRWVRGYDGLSGEGGRGGGGR